MRYYAPYIVSLIILLFISSALFHKGYKPKIRNYKYGNPEHEKLVYESRGSLQSDNFLLFRLYIGSDNAGGEFWYSVTLEKPGMGETQIFASFGAPAIDKLIITEKKVKLVSGRGSIDIPLDHLDERLLNPLVYFMGKEVEPVKASTDKI